MSQNKLGTSITTLGYEWDLTEETGKFYGDYTFKGWYPVFNVGVSSGKRSSNYYLIEETKTDDGQIVRLRAKFCDQFLNNSVVVDHFLFSEHVLCVCSQQHTHGDRGLVMKPGEIILHSGTP